MKVPFVSLVAALCGLFAGAAFAQAPANDHFANATSISGENGLLSTQSNVAATMQLGEPNSVFGSPSGASVWYFWTAPISAVATFQVGGSFDTQLSVYTGNSVDASALSTVAGSDAAFTGDPETVNFNVTAGTVYRIRVTGYQGDTGIFSLFWQLQILNGELALDPTSELVSETMGTVTLTVVRYGGENGTVGVSYTTAPGSAIAGSDYTTTSGTVSLGEGVTSQNFTVPILNDPDNETPETFTVALSAPTGGATLGGETTATVTITSDEAPGVLEFESTSVSYPEPGGPAVLTVLRTDGSTGPLSVDFAALPDGSATPGSDYTATSGVLNFADGQTSSTITVPITNDTALEDEESFLVELSNPSVAGTLGANSVAQVSIVSEDTLPGDNYAAGIEIAGVMGSVLASDAGATSEGAYEVDSGISVIWFQWTAPITGVVRFAVLEEVGHVLEIFRGTTYANKISISGPASVAPVASVTAGTTYRIAVGGGASDFTLSWAATTHGVLSLAGFQNYFDEAVGDFATRFIADEKGGNLTIKVRRTGGLDGPVSATFVAAADVDAIYPSVNAEAGVDFTAVTGTVTFLDGEAEKTFTIPILNDADPEDPIEHFVVSLSNPTGGALLGQALVQAQIFDDEGDPSNDDFINAKPIFGVSGSVDADITLADQEATESPLSGAGNTLWYRWTPPVGGAAEFVADAVNDPMSWTVDIFTANPSGLQRIARQLTYYDELGEPITTRAVFEAVPGQTYYVRLDTAFGGGVTATQLTWTTASGGLIAFGEQTYTVTEGAGATYDVVITRQGGLANGAAVTLSTFDNTTTDGVDYTGVNVTVVFNPGDVSKVVSIPILNDSQNEGDEFFALMLTAPSGGVLASDFNEKTVTLFDDEDDPTNDDFISRRALGVNGSRDGTTLGAGSETDEPDHGRFSVWYGWNSPAGNAGVATFSLNGTSGMAGPYVTVYTGTTLADLVKVSEGPDGTTFLTTPNTAYLIAITDRGGDDGVGGIMYGPSDFTLTFGFNAAGSLLSFESSSVEVAEAGASVVLTVTRSGSTTGPASVNFDLLDLLALQGEDYVYNTGTLEFASGDTAKTITVDILDDTAIEGDEDFSVSLSGATGATLVGGDGTTAKVTILDDDGEIVPPDNDNFLTAVELIGNNPVVAGFTGGATVEANEPFLRGALPQASVWYQWTAPANGAARLLLDSPSHSTSAYTGTTLASLSEVSFFTESSFAVTAGTTYYVPVNASGGSQFELTINFTMAGLFSFAPDSLQVSENSGPAAITIRRTNGTTGSVSVRLRTEGITATAGSDFTPVDTVVTFATGVSTQTVPVPITDDTFAEGGETVRLILSDATGGAIAAYGPDEVVVLTIQDDEVAVANDNFANALAISGPFGTTFGNNEGATAQSGEPNHALDGNGNSIWFRWTAPTGGIVTFETPGSSIAVALAAYTGSSVSALTAQDSDSNSGDESSISFAATAGVDYFIAVDSVAGGAQGEITLAWRLVAPGLLTFSPTSYAVTETSGSAVLTVTRAGGTDGAVSVSFTTNDGSAVAAQDFTSVSGTLSFAIGEASRTITVPIIDDTAVESPEAFTVTLSGATGGATIGTPTANVSLASDDVPSELSFNPTTYSVSEATVSVVLTVVRTGGGAGTASVNFTTVNGTAVAGQDFTAASGTLNFANGDVSETITVTLMNDTAFELGESFNVALSSPSAGATLGAANALVTLTSNDPFTPNAVAFAALVNPGGSHPTAGLLTLNEGTTGSFTGKLTLGGKVSPLKGAFDAFGNAIVTVARKGASTVAVAVQVEDGGKSIMGRVYDASFESDFTGEASFYDGKTRLYPQPGAFTMALLPADVSAGIPQGIGTATIKVKTNGTFSIKGGQLGDASSLSAAGFIAESGEVQFYALLYKGQGSVSGVVNFRDEPETDADGTLQWLKPPNLPAQKFFGAGFETELDLNASFYAKPAPNTRIDTAFDADSGGTLLTLDSGNLAAALEFSGLLDTKNKLTATAPLPLTFTGNSKTGGFSGSFTPASGKKAPLKGVFLQKSNQAVGQFFGASESGSVVVVPGI